MVTVWKGLNDGGTHLFEMFDFGKQHEVDMYEPGVLARPRPLPVPRPTVAVPITRILRTVNVHLQPPGIAPVTSTSPTNTFGNKLLPHVCKAMLLRPRKATAGAARPCPGVGLWPEAF